MGARWRWAGKFVACWRQAPQGFYNRLYLLNYFVCCKRQSRQLAQTTQKSGRLGARHLMPKIQMHGGWQPVTRSKRTPAGATTNRTLRPQVVVPARPAKPKKPSDDGDGQKRYVRCRQGVPLSALISARRRCVLCRTGRANRKWVLKSDA